MPQQTLKQKFLSRKFLLTVAALVYSIAKDDPKWGVLATGVYVVVQGYLDSPRV